MKFIRRQADHFGFQTLLLSHDKPLILNPKQLLITDYRLLITDY
jgi:hypothetical protein